MVRRPQPHGAGLLPQRVQIVLAHVREDQVLFVGDANFAEAAAFGPVGDAFHLFGGDIPRRRGCTRLGRQHHRGVARHLVRLHVAGCPAGERRIGSQRTAITQLGIFRRTIPGRFESGRDAGVLVFGQLRLAVAEKHPLALHLAGEGLDAQRLDQDLDPRLVLVVAPAVAVVHAQDGFDVGQQVLPRQVVADHLAEHRRAAESAADQHPQAQLALGVARQVQADVVHHHRCAILLGGADGNLEFAWQEEEFRVDRRPLAEDFRQRARVQHLIRSHAGERLGGDVAHAVAGGLDRMHLDLGQLFENLRHLLQLDPVELDVLPRGEVAVATVVVAGDPRQRAQLPARQGAVGNCHAQHVRMLLQVQAVLQTQRQEFLFAQFATEPPRHLVAKLRNALAHQGVVVFVVLIHRQAPRSGDRGDLLCAAWLCGALWPAHRSHNSGRSCGKKRIRYPNEPADRHLRPIATRQGNAHQAKRHQ
ncbi:hypothetical protein D9M71_266330 [compost metagenome]